MLDDELWPAVFFGVSAAGFDDQVVRSLAMFAVDQIDCK